MKCLLVGAGAVGQAYGRHLQLGGVDVAFLVRPKYADAARAGFDVYPLNRKHPRREPVRFEGFRVLTTTGEVAREPWAAVLVCVSSTALREGTWVADLARATGDATWLSLQPGIEDRAFVLERVAEPRVLCGMISLLSYQAPLPGEHVPRPGMAYWLPPGPACPMTGARERTEPLVAAFRRGGMRAAPHPDVTRALAFGAGALGAHIAALECAGWSFARLRKERDPLALASRATGESLAIAARHTGARPPLALRLLSPFAMRMLTRAAPRIMPLDVETYLRVHFTKVGDQTRAGLESLAQLGERYGLARDALRELAARLDLVRAQA